MRQFDSLRGITRRELNINYRSPLICQLAVPFSVSGSNMIACVPVYRRDGPLSVDAETFECESVTVSWDAVDLAFGYSVSRAESENGPWTQVLDLSPDLSFTDSVPAGNYFYRVVAVFEDTGSSNPTLSGEVTVEAC